VAPDRPSASIVVPTRARPDYLDVTLASIVPQARAAGAEVIVARDGRDPATAVVAERHGAQLVSLERPTSANAARNAGIAAARGELIVLIDDDIEAPAGWLPALLAGAEQSPEHEVFGGPIRARLEGGGPRACGREAPPITALDLGPHDHDVARVWGANMAIRRRALERVGPFDEALHGHGDEEEWEHRYVAGGGRIRYLARAGLEHRRTRADSTLGALARAAYHQGRARRRLDVRVGISRSVVHELRILAGCGWHLVRRRCLYGIVMAARTAGAIREALADIVAAPTASDADGPPFLSGTSGQVYGIRATTRALALDATADAVALATAQPARITRLARRGPGRRVLVLAVEREEGPTLLGAAIRELRRSRHAVEIASAPVGGRGKFENLNRLLDAHPAAGHDWLLLLDDDVALPAGFLDRFIALAEAAGLSLAQPAHRQRSHAAWPVTRRRAGCLVRETGFVEIGPLAALHARTFEALLPFPPLRFGWGLDAHWAAVARSHGWRIGVVDATPIGHGLRRIAAAYDRGEAVAEARRFLADHAYVPASEAGRTLAVHRRLP
jgi:GT2 family glycosyltransferase